MSLSLLVFGEDLKTQDVGNSTDDAAHSSHRGKGTGALAWVLTQFSINTGICVMTMPRS